MIPGILFQEDIGNMVEDLMAAFRLFFFGRRIPLGTQPLKLIGG